MQQVLRHAIAIIMRCFTILWLLLELYLMMLMSLLWYIGAGQAGAL